MTAKLLGALLESSARASLVAVMVAGLLFVCRARANSVCGTAWTAVLGAMLAMPVLPSLVPSIAVTVPIAAPAWQAIAEAPIRFLNPQPSVEFERFPAPGSLGSDTASPAVVARGVDSTDPKGPGVRVLPSTLAILYGIGFLALFGRLLVGAWNLLRVTRNTHQLHMPDFPWRVYACAAVSVPLTAGVLRPRIILPVSWPTWPDEKLAAVLAHERAHVRRRDPLVLLLAHVNRCMFWFHPLAWWLERKLAVTAEHAGDEAGIRAIGESRRYAEVLLEMAESARRRRGRVVWQGVGIDGAGLLAQRIDTILRGDLLTRTSRTRKAMVALGCAASIVIGVACRQARMPAPLKEDPALAARLVEQRANIDRYRAAEEMTRQQVAELEAAAMLYREDLATRKKLIQFYDRSGRQMLGWNEMIAARRPHLLWLIEHHPDDELAASRGVSKSIDPAGYEQARTLWLAHTAKADASPAVLGRAARFLEIADRPRAEQLLRRAAAAADPGQKSSWTARLGELYALAILGATDISMVNTIRSVSEAEAHGPYTTRVRQTLADSTDPALLYGAGAYLAFPARDVKVDFDHVALGNGYLERAVQLDPASNARRMLLSLRVNDRYRRLREALRSKQLDLAGGEIARKGRAGERLSREEQNTLAAFELRAVLAMNERDQFTLLRLFANSNYMGAEYQDYVNHDTAAAGAAWTRSKEYAQRLLALAPRFKTDPAYGDAVYDASVALGTHALREGDRTTAVRFMLEAVKVPPLSEELGYTGTLDDRLVKYLLHAGERESVAQFLERAAQINAPGKDRKLADAAAIRAGQMPAAYQYMINRRE